MIMAYLSKEIFWAMFQNTIHIVFQRFYFKVHSRVTVVISTLFGEDSSHCVSILCALVRQSTVFNTYIK